MVGTTLGHYRIVSLLGKGGMGEVYAAEDQRLGRRVAVKVLPPALISGPGDLERLEREARAVASLNHPGIVTLYSLEEAGGVRFLTMELVDGQPLGDQLPANGFASDKLLDIGERIADAISAAHEKGIVHRDLKPGNVLLTASGQVKVLDFGLAKLREPSSFDTEVPTQQLTGEGHIVGTVSYMAPEQAEGKPTDHRSDIFSLGVLLYELATGRRPFHGDTNLSVLSSLLKDTPKPASEINAAVPGSIARVLKTCLQKDPERRFQSAKDLRNELRTIREELASAEAPAAARPTVPRRTSAAVPILAGLLALSIIGMGYLVFTRDANRSTLPVMRHVQVTSAAGTEAMPSLSPDGKWLVYIAAPAGNADVFLQAVGGQTTINLTKDSRANEAFPSFSPDGERIAFLSSREGGGLFVMGRTGEAQRRLTNEGTASSWSPDGKEIVYATASASDPVNRTALSSLRIVRVDSGESRLLLQADGMHPAWSPNGKYVAYWGLTSETGDTVRARDIWVIAATGGTPWRVTNDVAVDWCPQWSPDGRFLYFTSDRGGTMNLWRVAMDPDSGRPAGREPEPLTTPAPFIADLDVSKSGAHIAYASRLATRNVYRRSFDAAHLVAGPAEAITSGTKGWYSVDPSPDGTQLVLSSYQPREDIYISRADGSEMRQLTTDDFFDRFPRWSPDGRQIAFYSNRTGKYEVWSLTPGGQLRQLTDTPDFSAIYPRWSPDGTRMIFMDVTKGALAMFDPAKPWREQTPDVWPAVPRSAGQAVSAPHWSPDGKQVALGTSGEILLFDIAKRTYDKLGPGGVIDWHHDGRLLIIGPGGIQLYDTVRRTRSPVTFQGGGPQESPVSVRLSRDGNSLYYVQPDTQSDIWLIELTDKR